jgi:hypothetical protein
MTSETGADRASAVTAGRGDHREEGKALRSTRLLARLEQRRGYPGLLAGNAGHCQGRHPHERRTVAGAEKDL